MNLPSKYLEEVVEHFASLPGIGKKTALRLVLNLLKRDEEELQQFAGSIQHLKANISSCETCGNITDAKLCSICLLPNRNKNIICVVEDIRDVMAIESTEQYFGTYHVLGGIISPMEGIGPNDLNISLLSERLKSNTVEEVILALPTSMEGDTTNFYLYRKISAFKVKITTLTRGVSVGTELHYADEITLGRSIVNRMPFELNFSQK
ncbi:recombination protein RecR [Putridiphycobacter roseus]|uniref:Recombination protein RecR n=1 Tax=Putridiphycobacter roseus TaxID=2219161 RepID=A0A2W1NCY4_9FLAO|nr:recombination mediator RecR [Putridiphycobacter roseus]PZE17265.1 recombination protein RecR [Putridiphycobacter roseus]